MLWFIVSVGLLNGDVCSGRISKKVPGGGFVKLKGYQSRPTSFKLEHVFDITPVSREHTFGARLIALHLLLQLDNKSLE